MDEVEKVEQVLFLDIAGKHLPSAGFRAHPCYHLDRLLTSGSFYYSKSFDLTTRLENRIKVDQHRLYACTPRSRRDGTAYDPPPWLAGTPEFEWNHFLLEPLRRFKDTLDNRQQAWWHSRFFELSIIQGYSGCRTLEVEGEKILLTVTSRRGWARSGTRFAKRGIDEDGNVANYVEVRYLLSLILSAFLLTL
jgi:hypothetical protein